MQKGRQMFRAAKFIPTADKKQTKQNEQEQKPKKGEWGETKEANRER